MSDEWNYAIFLSDINGNIIWGKYIISGLGEGVGVHLGAPQFSERVFAVEERIYHGNISGISIKKKVIQFNKTWIGFSSILQCTYYIVHVI